MGPTSLSHVGSWDKTKSEDFGSSWRIIPLNKNDLFSCGHQKEIGQEIENNIDTIDHAPTKNRSRIQSVLWEIYVFVCHIIHDHHRHHHQNPNNIIIINTTVVNKIMIIIIIITIIKSLAAFLDPRKSSKHPFESLLHYVIPYGVLQLHHCSELFPKNIFGNLRFVPSSVCKA